MITVSEIILSVSSTNKILSEVKYDIIIMLQDLERKAAELQRKEQELQRMQFGGRVFIFNLTFSQKRLV